MALTYDPEIALALAPMAESGFNPSSRVTATSRPDTNGKTYRARHPPDHSSTARSGSPRPGTGVSYTNDIGALMLRPNRLRTGAPAFRAGLTVA